MKRANTCSICNSLVHKAIAKCSNYLIERCSTCGVVYAVDLGAIKHLNSIYDDFYSGRRIFDNFDAVRYLVINFMKNRLNIIHSLRNGCFHNMKFLDVGCGAGHHVYAASKLGLESYGIEIDIKCVERAKVLEIDHIYHTNIEDAPFEDGYFDIIQMFHVLEHCPEPAVMIKKSYKLLRRGGVLIVDVPNQNSRIAKLKIILHNLKLRNNDYGYLQPPLHLFAFTPLALKYLLTTNGFNVKYTYCYSPANCLFYPSALFFNSSLKWKIIKLVYKLFGIDSYMSFFATKE